MTFNSEMFLRVMSLCHTVVVEKDLDLSDNIDASKSVTSHASSTSNTKKYGKKMFGKRDRATSEMSANSAGYGLGMVAENKEADFGANRNRAQSTGSVSLVSGVQKGKDGAPLGFAYQAESPDEGALVSAASKSFGFQVVTPPTLQDVLADSESALPSEETMPAFLRPGMIPCARKMLCAPCCPILRRI